MRHKVSTVTLLSFAIALACAAPASAAVLGGVDIMSSTVFQEHQSSFSGLGLRMRVHPPQLVEQIALMPTIEYWRNSSNVQPFDIQSTRKDATLGADLVYQIPREGLSPYFGAGFGLHFISTEVTAPSLGLNDASDSLTKAGVTALGGVTFALAGRLHNLIEVKYHHIPDHSQFKINWGLAIDLGAPDATP